MGPCPSIVWARIARPLRSLGHRRWRLWPPAVDTMRSGRCTVGFKDNPGTSFQCPTNSKCRKQEQRVRPRPHYAHLPHETFAALAAFPDLWEFVLGSPDDFSSFWAGSASVASAVGQEWLAGIKAVWAAQHPDSAWADAVHLLCPLGMHGDEAGGHGHSKILVMTWGSVAVDRPTLDSRILFTMLKDSDSAGRPTTDGIHNVLVWSLQALAAGVYPSTDENGRAFGPQHHPHRAALAGQSLASARCGVFAELRGDWEYLWKAV